MLVNLKKIEAKIAIKSQSLWSERPQKKYEKDEAFSSLVTKFKNHNELYAYMHHYYKNLCPLKIQLHRKYYQKERRGFGENAFHAMWYTLLREFKPKNAIEIGVYRGQTISLWALIANELKFDCQIHGISPFTSDGDEVSIYMKNIDYLQDTLSHHSYFGLNSPTLIRAYSTDTIALKHIQSRKWDLIYIDGNHDYEVALADYIISKDNLSKGGILVMDDSSLYTDYKPQKFSFAGHPGPSRVVNERAMKELKFLGGVGHNNIFINTELI